MKSLITLVFIVATTLLISSFSASKPATAEKKSTTTKKVEKETTTNETVTNSDVWNYMRENVFTDLDELAEYDKERMFSRCPSGFGQYMDDEISDNHMIFGTITFRQGCSEEDFCFYQLNWDKKKTSLKKEEKDEYVSVDTFVKNEKKKIAKI